MCGIVSGPVIAQSTFLVPLLAREAVAFTGKAAEASFAVGKKFFAVDKAARGIDNYIAAAKVIAQVELNPRCGVSGLRGAYAHEGNTLLVVHHVKMIVFAR